MDHPIIRDVDGVLTIAWPEFPPPHDTYPVAGELIEKFVETENENRQLRLRAAGQAIEVLNRVHAADPTVLPALVSYRVPCNDAVADDPTVQVGHIDDDPTKPCEVGLLGILNGIFGIRAGTQGWIGAISDAGGLVRFELTGEH